MPARIVSRAEWLVARQAHLKSEKALTRVRDLVAAERRSLPWVRIAEGAIVHLAVSYVQVSRALIERLEAYRKLAGAVDVLVRQ